MRKTMLYYMNKLRSNRSVTVQLSGCGSVWLERCVRDAEAGGSNPLTPTIFLPKWAKKHEAVRIRFMARSAASCSVSCASYFAA